MLHTASFFRWATGTRRRLDLEQVGGECLDVAFRYPRRPEIGVDVAGQHVFGLHRPQGVGVAGVVGPARSAAASLARTLPER